MSEGREFSVSARKKILGELCRVLDKLEANEAIRGDRRAQEAVVLLGHAIGHLRFYAEVPRKGRP
jgi:hypothetical protein